MDSDDESLVRSVRRPVRPWRPSPAAPALRGRTTCGSWARPAMTAVHYDGHGWTEAAPSSGEVWLERVRSSPEAGTWAVGYHVAADHTRTPAALKWNGNARQAATVPSDTGAQLEDIAAATGGMVAARSVHRVRRLIRETRDP